MRGFSTLDVISRTTVTLQKGTLTYRNEAPATDEGSKQLTTANVDVLRTERHEVVGCANGVGRDVYTQGDDDQADRSKGSSSTAAM